MRCEERAENWEQTTRNWFSIPNMLYEVTIDGKNHQLQLERADGIWQCRLDGLAVQVDAILNRRNVLSLLMNGKAYDIKRELTTSGLNIWVGTTRYAVQIRDPRSLRRRKDGAGDDLSPKELVAPMPGKVVRILVSEMTEVEAGQGIVIVEAMKMQNEIKSPKKGILQKLFAAEGSNVNAGDVLAIVE
jgi:biotin carboxyl carrier protein